jgi:hypothetical protein
MRRENGRRPRFPWDHSNVELVGNVGPIVKIAADLPILIAVVDDEDIATFGFLGVWHKGSAVLVSLLPYHSRGGEGSSDAGENTGSATTLSGNPI